VGIKRENIIQLKVSTLQEILSSREALLLYVIIGLGWGVYRLLFRLPTIIEETILKAIVFGIPVFYVAHKRQWRWKELGMTVDNLTASVYLGILLGMILGVAGNFGNTIRHGGLQFNDFGLTSATLGSFIILSLVTAFWEQLLFTGMFLRLLAEVIKDEWKLTWLVAILFVGLHIPALLLIQQLQGVQFVVAVILLLLLQMGSVILMLRYKNLAAPIMAQALWGVTVFLFR
jgi:hypothetical protein